MTWLEHSVQVEVEAPVDQVWSLWSDLEQMPQWMQWIHSVEILPENPELSRWTLRWSVWEFSWLSRTLKVIPHQIIQWESVDGLPNRGAIRFYDRQSHHSIVKLTIAYALPDALALIMDNLFVVGVVENNLKADLERFRDYALRQNYAHQPDR
jgi:uncharacterized membrane protein